MKCWDIFIFFSSLRKLIFQQTDIYADIINELLQVPSNFARKTNKKGLSPLHYASSRGHLEITKLLLSHDPDLTLQYDIDGHTPLHLAVINGYMTIIEAFLSSSPTSFGYLTRDGETVFHLAIRFEKYNTFIYLSRFFNSTNLIGQQDGFGNTILHLAVRRENYQVTHPHLFLFPLSAIFTHIFIEKSGIYIGRSGKLAPVF